MTPKVNPYLSGGYAPVTDESTFMDLEVIGSVPEELDGTFLRVGPNPIVPTDPSSYHWFLGDGMVHAIDLQGGRAVSYRNRWVRTDHAAAALGEEPIPDQPPEVFLPGANVANTSIVTHAGRTLALVEVCLPTEITASADTLGRHDFGGRLRTSMTAHPKIDPVTSEMFFFGYDLFGPPYIRFHVVDAAGALARTEPITFAGPTLVHDFAITEQSVIWMDLPVVFDASLIGQRPFPFSWQPDRGARIGVMPRSGGDVDIQWFEIEPCFVYHVLNAYETPDQVVIDVIRYGDMFTTDRHGAGGSEPSLERITLHRRTGVSSRERIDDRAQEFPRVADRRVGRRHRYGYTVTEHSLLKYDLDLGVVEAHHLGDTTVPGEAIFVPSAAANADDEGWLLTIVHDTRSQHSALLVIDAHDLRTVAHIAIPQRIPHGFHAHWVARFEVPVGLTRRGSQGS